MTRPGRRMAVAAALTAGCASACLPDPATEQARAVSELWTVFMVAAALVGATVWGLITFMVLRYRRRPPEVPDDRQYHGAPLIEIAWTAGPVLIVLFLFASTLGALGRIDARAPDATRVEVDGFRWQWRFTYPDSGASVIGTRDTPAELVLPAGRPVRILLTASDVIHSFYVPAFLFKRDAIPGHPTEFDLTVSEPGVYRGQCAEFCGVFHDRMTLTVRALPGPEFDAWIAGQGGTGAPGGPASPAAGSPIP